jgi:hypothetical protein
LNLQVDVGDFGSGFIFNPDGYIMTNAHVATSLISKASFVYEVAQNYTNQIVRGISMRANVRWFTWMTQNFQRDYYQFLRQKGSFSNERTQLTVMFGQYQNTTDSALNDLTAKGIHADVKAVGRVGGKDAAVLKVDVDYKLPTVQFGDSDSVASHLGEQVVVLGYPAMSTDVPQASGVKRWRILQGSGGSGGEQSIEPTATAGIASAIKTLGRSSSGEGRFSYIQTDASIHPGNSGGPAFDPQGEAIGLATLGASDPNNPGAELSNIGFLLPINTAAEFSNQINVKNVRGPIDSYWELALNYYWAHHYSAAIEQFQKVQALYPAHPYAPRFIASSQRAIARGQDIKIVTTNSTAGSDVGFNMGGTSIWGIPFYGILGGIIAIVLVVIFFLMRRQRAVRRSSPHVASTPPDQSSEQKYCTKCHAVLPVKAKFCLECGQQT